MPLATSPAGRSFRLSNGMRSATISVQVMAMPRDSHAWAVPSALRNLLHAAARNDLIRFFSRASPYWSLMSVKLFDTSAMHGTTRELTAGRRNDPNAGFRSHKRHTADPDSRL